MGKLKKRPMGVGHWSTLISGSEGNGGSNKFRGANLFKTLISDTNLSTRDINHIKGENSSHT